MEQDGALLGSWLSAACAMSCAACLISGSVLKRPSEMRMEDWARCSVSPMRRSVAEVVSDAEVHAEPWLMAMCGRAAMSCWASMPGMEMLDVWGRRCWVEPLICRSGICSLRSASS